MMTIRNLWREITRLTKRFVAPVKEEITKRPFVNLHEKNMSRDISMIIIHCSATKSKMDVGVEEIRRWHLDRGWSDIGYHDVIRRDGKLEVGRPVNKIGAHAAGYNKNSIGVCLIGGIDDEGKADENFTSEQWLALSQLLRGYRVEYPSATIIGHNEISHKECPSFDVQKYLAKAVI